jgi:hypothetical protein
MATMRRSRKYDSNIYIFGKKQAANNLKSCGDKKEMVVIFSRIKQRQIIEFFF